jgi:hypothetical protein
MAFFLLGTTLGRILTVDNLRRRGFQLVNQWCLCKKDKETIDHLLIHCEYTADICHLVLNSFGVSWVMPSNILQLLHCWKYLGREHPKVAIWKVIPALLMWSIWREWNCRLFEDSETNVFFLKSSFLISFGLDYCICSQFSFLEYGRCDLFSRL